MHQSNSKTINQSNSKPVVFLEIPFLFLYFPKESIGYKSSTLLLYFFHKVNAQFSYNPNNQSRAVVVGTSVVVRF